jgi:cobalamin biosynthesis Mg chelatase CobN
MRTLLFTAQVYSCSTYSRGDYGKTHCDNSQNGSSASSNSNNTQKNQGQANNSTSPPTTPKNNSSHETFMTQVTHLPSEAATTVAHTSYWILLPIIFALAIFIAWLMLLWKRRHQKDDNQNNGGFTPPSSPPPPFI